MKQYSGPTERLSFADTGWTMDFVLNPAQKQFQDELCRFLQKELPAEVKKAHEDLTESDRYMQKFRSEFLKKLAQAGYLGIGWPPEYGGGGKDMVYQVLGEEELAYHEAPHLSGTYRYVAPAIMLFGTEELKQRFLPPISRAELETFTGYSEPEAGSDLANLQTRAVLEGDEFVVNGQKLFSSGAHHAHYAWLLARTDPDAPRHKGLSILLVDMESPGISLAWYKTMAGWWHHGVYFDNVRVPRSNLVGELNQGWYHIMAALDYERASNGNPGHVMRLFDRLLSYCRETKRDGSYVIDVPTVRNLLADLHADVAATRWTAYWVASMHAQGSHPQHETSLVTMFMRETARKIEVAHMELLGPYAPIGPGSPQARQGGMVAQDYLNDMFFHFAAGGFDITRNVIARRGLGLPRD